MARGKNQGGTENTEAHGDHNFSVLLSRKSLVSWKEFCLADFLAFLAVNADPQINRQDAKDAKKTPSKTIWLRLCCSVNLRVLRVLRGESVRPQ